MNKAVQKAASAYFERTGKTEDTALNIWEGTPYDQYDGDFYQFTECLTEVSGVRLENDGTDNPVVSLV